MNQFAGTGTLIRFILRRDRLRLPIWIVGITGFVLLFASSLPGIYATEADRQARADLWDNPIANLMRGPGYGLDNYTFGVMVAAEILLYIAVAAALMSIFLIIRHTRREEETGRLELIRASTVGVFAQPAAALIVVSAAHLLNGVLIATLLPLVGEDMAFAGSLAMGAGVAATGIVFAGVALVVAQLIEFGRGASSVGAMVVAAAFLIRAIGDVQGSVISWFSPLFWAQSMRPFVDERWWPLALAGITAVALVSVAFALNIRRDVAAGLVRPRQGQANASDSLAHPVGFAFRQLRGSLIGWSIGLIVLGFAFGSTIGEISKWIADNPEMAEFVAAFEGISLLDSLIGFLVLILAMLATGFAIPAVLRARAEETSGHAEALLSTALGRTRWIGSYLLIAMVGSAVVLLLGAGALGILSAIDQNDTSLFWQILGAALAYVPAIWLLIGLVSVFFGFFPKGLAVPWVVLLFAVAAGLFGDLLNMPGWMYNASPFEHVPELPGGEFTLLSIVVLTGIALGLIIIGVIGFGRRDLQSV
jgi:ABC-2 type transport system permease protein